MKKKSLSVIPALFAVLLFAHTLFGQSTAFSYQGSLQNGANPTSGNHDFEFALFDSLAGGSQIGSTVSVNNVMVSNGIFSVQIDFGNQFPGANRFLEIRVRPAGQPGITVLSPRQLLNSAPYSVKSLTAETATTASNAAQLGGVAANQFVVTTDPRMSDSRNPLGGSGLYVQNRASQQGPANFNISGNGTVAGTLSGNVVNAGTQFNIAGNRVFSSPGVLNTFAGINAGLADVTGNSNTYFGHSAGEDNISGQANSFFGSQSGNNNVGTSNSFFGTSAGFQNTTGNRNAFFGAFSGVDNTIGTNNSFFGFRAGSNNITGGGNAFFGHEAGNGNTSGGANAFFGASAGSSNTTGQNNAFFGANAGAANTISIGNSFFGANAGAANVAQSNSFFGASAGLVNTTGFRNAFFGTVAGVANTTGDSNSFFGYFAGHDNTTGSGNSFFGTLTGESNNIGSSNAFFGTLAGQSNTAGIQNAFLGRSAGQSNTTGDNNVFVGFAAGDSNQVGNNNTMIGAGADFTATNLTYATAIGSEALVSTSNTVVLGRGVDIVRIPGFLRVAQLGSTGVLSLCNNINDTISSCSSSIRYKENIRQFNSGLSLVSLLRPVSFNWKDGGMSDLGLVAEEVAALEPLLTTTNAKGEIEGVKYDRLGVVLVNAVKEQQTQIEDQRRTIDQLRQQVEGLRQLVCVANATAAICKEK